MQLPGRLSASTLGDLLGALHRQRTTGTLELVESASGRLHRVHLVAGLVTAVETSAGVPPIGEILRRAGYFDASAIARMLKRLASGDRRPAGEILVAEGIVDGEALSAALREQVRAKLDELFRLEDAAIRFHAARRSGAAPAGPLTPSDFLHGRPRARDRRARAGTPPASPSSHAPPPRDARARTRMDPARGEALRALGLSGEPDTAEIRRAFRRLAASLHPDRAASAPAETPSKRTARFAELSAAYHLLVA